MDMKRREEMATTKLRCSEIRDFFKDTTVFLTGATGAVGKVLFEKLLRSCPEISRMYVLIRDKKEKSYEKRFQELISVPLFERLKKEQPNFLEKVTLIVGDCASPDLGLTDQDKRTLIDEVNCVFHCAATVHFDEKIRNATYINVRATRDVLVMCRHMDQLKAFVHISTAYSNCVYRDIEEKFYEPRITARKLLKLLDSFDDDFLDQITPTILGDWPNTYAFTKAIAEDVVRTEGKGLPVAMVRPSAVIATAKEPMPGWIDNVYGPTGIFLGAAMGVLRTLHCKAENMAEMVPADFFISCTIAAAWEVGTKGLQEIETSEVLTSNHDEDEIPIYNYVSSPQKPFNWREVMSLTEFHLKQIPSPLQIWHHCFTLNANYFVHMLYVIFLHRIPAYLVDFLAYCLGKQPMMVKAYQKIDKFTHVLEYFGMNEWRFRNDNTQALWKKLSPIDRKNFEFDMGALDWNSFFYTYARGGRMYLLKDPMDTLPEGRVKYFKLQVAHYTLVGLILFGLVKLALAVWGYLF